MSTADKSQNLARYKLLPTAKAKNDCAQAQNLQRFSIATAISKGVAVTGAAARIYVASGLATALAALTKS